jgi:pyridoxine 5-phosphate synthase
MITKKLHLGVNIDHVATIRNARGGWHPDPVRAARIAAAAGADGITVHLREDRRHISDDDIVRLKDSSELPLNMLMAATPEMQAIALRHKPDTVCLMPERPQMTSGGAFDAIKHADVLRAVVSALNEGGVRVGIFVEPDHAQFEAVKVIGAQHIEMHSGIFCNAPEPRREQELARVRKAAQFGVGLGLDVYSGHGLTYETVPAIASIHAITGITIGHFLIGEAIFSGLAPAIARLRALMDEGRRAG